MNLKYLKSRAIRVEVTQMHGIAMMKSCCVQSFAVVIHCHGTINDLVFPISVYVRHTQIMIALPGITRVTGGIGIKCPLFGQLSITPVISHEHCAGVVPTRHDQTWALSIQISNGGKESVHPIAVVIPQLDTLPRAGS